MLLGVNHVKVGAGLVHTVSTIPSHPPVLKKTPVHAVQLWQTELFVDVHAGSAYCVPDVHTVQGVHTVLADVVQAVEEYVPAEHTVQGVHTVLADVVQTPVRYVPVEHTEQGVHTKSADVVQALEAYVPAAQTVEHAMHGGLHMTDA